MRKDFHIVFIDEAGFMLGPLARATWARRGHTPVLKVSENHHDRIKGHINFVWDSIKIHTAESVNIFLALHSAIRVFFFSPYAPELNPVDNVWGYIKYNRLANFCPHDLIELRKRVRSELFRIQKRPDLLKVLFRYTGLNLD